MHYNVYMNMYVWKL